MCPNGLNMTTAMMVSCKCSIVLLLLLGGACSYPSTTFSESTFSNRGGRSLSGSVLRLTHWPWQTSLTPVRPLYSAPPASWGVFSRPIPNHFRATPLRATSVRAPPLWQLPPLLTPAREHRPKNDYVVFSLAPTSYSAPSRRPPRYDWTSPTSSPAGSVAPLTPTPEWVRLATGGSPLYDLVETVQSGARPNLVIRRPASGRVPITPVWPSTPSSTTTTTTPMLWPTTPYPTTVGVVPLRGDQPDEAEKDGETGATGAAAGPAAGAPPPDRNSGAGVSTSSAPLRDVTTTALALETSTLLDPTPLPTGAATPREDEAATTRHPANVTTYESTSERVSTTRSSTVHPAADIIVFDSVEPAPISFVEHPAVFTTARPPPSPVTVRGTTTVTSAQTTPDMVTHGVTTTLHQDWDGETTATTGHLFHRDTVAVTETPLVTTVPPPSEFETVATTAQPEYSTSNPVTDEYIVTTEYEDTAVVTNEPTVTTSRPAYEDTVAVTTRTATTAQPVYEDPVVVTSEPAREDTIVTTEPAVSTTQPLYETSAFVTDEPAVSTYRPLYEDSDVVTSESAVTTERPANEATFVTVEPAVTTTQPLHEDSAVVTVEPTVTTTQPLYEDSAVVTVEPAVTTTQPLYEDSAVVTVEPAVTTTQPLYEDSAVVTAEPAVTTTQPLYEDSAVVTVEPAVTTAQPSFDDSVAATDAPVVTTARPVYEDDVATSEPALTTGPSTAENEVTPATFTTTQSLLTPFTTADPSMSTTEILDTIEIEINRRGKPDVAESTTAEPTTEAFSPLAVEALQTTDLPPEVTTIAYTSSNAITDASASFSTTSATSEVPWTFKAEAVSTISASAEPFSTPSATTEVFSTHSAGASATSDAHVTSTESYTDTADLTSLTTLEGFTTGDAGTNSAPNVQTTYRAIASDQQKSWTEEFSTAAPTSTVYVETVTPDAPTSAQTYNLAYTTPTPSPSDSPTVFPEVYTVGSAETFWTTFSTGADKTYSTSYAEGPSTSSAEASTSADAYTDAPTASETGEVYSAFPEEAAASTTTISASTDRPDDSTYTADAYTAATIVSEDGSSDTTTSTSDTTLTTTDIPVGFTSTDDTYTAVTAMTEAAASSEDVAITMDSSTVTAPQAAALVTTPPPAAAKEAVPTSAPVRDFNYYDGVAFEDGSSLGGSPADGYIPDYDTRSDEYDGDYFADAARLPLLPPPTSSDTKGLEIASLVRETPAPPKQVTHRGDVPIEYDEDEDDDDGDSNDIGFGAGLQATIKLSSTPKPVVTTSRYAGDSFEGQMLRRMVPLVVRQLRMGHLSDEDLTRLRYIFGPIWPEVERTLRVSGRVRRDTYPHFTKWRGGERGEHAGGLARRSTTASHKTRRPGRRPARRRTKKHSKRVHKHTSKSRTGHKVKQDPKKEVAAATAAAAVVHPAKPGLPVKHHVRKHHKHHAKATEAAASRPKRAVSALAREVDADLQDEYDYEEENDGDYMGDEDYYEAEDEEDPEDVGADGDDEYDEDDGDVAPPRILDDDNPSVMELHYRGRQAQGHVPEERISPISRDLAEAQAESVEEDMAMDVAEYEYY